MKIKKSEFQIGEYRNCYPHEKQTFQDEVWSTFYILIKPLSIEKKYRLADFIFELISKKDKNNKHPKELNLIKLFLSNPQNSYKIDKVNYKLWKFRQHNPDENENAYCIMHLASGLTGAFNQSQEWAAHHLASSACSLVMNTAHKKKEFEKILQYILALLLK